MTKWAGGNGSTGVRCWPERTKRLCYNADMLTLTQPHPDPYRRLLCAVLLLAWRDATGPHNTPQRREAAIAWLHSPGAENACDWLDLDVGCIRQNFDEYFGGNAQVGGGGTRRYR